MNVKYVVVSGLCLLAILGAVGPALAADGPTIGVELGANPSSARLGGNLNQFNSGTKVGLAAGAFFSVRLTPMLSVQPEVLYVQKHSTLNTIEPGYFSNLVVNEVEIPVLAKIDVSRFYVVAGPALGFITSAKSSDIRSGGGLSPEVDLKAIDQVQSTDFSVILGAGIHKGNLGFEARYELGLNNIARNAPGHDSSVKPSSFTGLVRVFVGPTR